MGPNLEGQLGLKVSKPGEVEQPASTAKTDYAEPELVHDLKFNKVVKVRAGTFSAALTQE